MKKSIRLQITFTFVIVLSALIGAIILFNNIFLEKIYFQNRVSILKKTYDVLNNGIDNFLRDGNDIEDLFKKGDTAVEDTSYMKFLREMQDVYNINIVLVDEDNNFYSLFSNNNRYDKRIMSYMFDRSKQSEVVEENDKYKIVVNNETEPQRKSNSKEKQKNNPQNDLRNYSLESFGFLNDNKIAFLMSIPVISMKEPIDMFNDVLGVISVFIIVLGALIVFATSYSISQPIVRLAKLSKKMSQQDFESKYEGHREDEIGLLGESMNEMSENLEKAIKELKNANMKLKEDIEKKEKLDIMREEFIANVSHELKTPIALIEGYAESLSTGIVTTKEDKEYYLNVIIDESEKMKKLVMQLLDLSNIERGIEDVNIERINLYELIRNISKTYELLIKQNDINFKICIKEDIFVWTDEFKLEEVIKNYLTNAMHHVDENKLIHLGITKENENTIRLYVYNSGKHLSEENLSNIWEKFYKVDKAHTRSYGGTGLGLSIVKAIANQFNVACGCINVNEDKAKGIKDGVAFYYDLNIK